MDAVLAAFVDADVFVLPSYTENFGMAVVEAMACGLSVVISDKVNIWREIAHADAGSVVSCNVDKLANALQRCINDPEMLIKQGLNGKRLVQEKYTWDRVAEQMVQVYEKILNYEL